MNCLEATFKTGAVDNGNGAKFSLIDLGFCQSRCNNSNAARARDLDGNRANPARCEWIRSKRISPNSSRLVIAVCATPASVPATSQSTLAGRIARLVGWNIDNRGAPPTGTDDPSSIAKPLVPSGRSTMTPANSVPNPCRRGHVGRRPSCGGPCSKNSMTSGGW